MDVTKLSPGDWVIYRKQKISNSPGERAIDVRPSSGGDLYQYMVDKFWVVLDVTEDGKVVLRTRRGKQHTVEGDDPRLRTPRFWERWWYRDRFTAIDLTDATPPDSPDTTDPFVG